MERALPLIIAGIGGAVLGGIVIWFVAGANPRPQPPIEPQQAQATPDDRPSWEEFEQVQAERDKLREAYEAATAIEQPPAISEAELEKALAERDQANARANELEAELDALKAAIPPAAERGNLAVPFGKWSELAEVRDADWGEIGGAAHAMIPLLKELADVMREGKEMPPALGQKIGEHNRKLIAYWARVANKLPTNADVNGEFSHPINMANMLAAQLAAAGEPLSEQQVSQISALGEEYDRRWTAAIAGYNERTFQMQKLLDEGEMKEWFKAEMMRVCTASQRAIAVPPAIDGLVGLDLYSAGLIFQMNVSDVQAPDEEQLKERLKTTAGTLYGLDSAVLEGAHFLFNDWVLALQTQLQPRAQAELFQYRTAELIQSGRAQLKAMQAIHADYVRDETIRETIRQSVSIIYPRIPAEQG